VFRVNQGRERKDDQFAEPVARRIVNNHPRERKAYPDCGAPSLSVQTTLIVRLCFLFFLSGVTVL